VAAWIVATTSDDGSVQRSQSIVAIEYRLDGRRALVE
jgi:hypothetical protein